ncbi:hypothetical protein Ahy_A07g032073 [Arachis hypogaea]|uniref:Aminotransferase-like plant mobile domain-containing protein n=1 Tax=Arachis hypogaea TaxID=3818 RepID=A0A445C5Z2_ARAHY|nr:hypothetical protein Ahy_A07g032073 [Arachis hypogaea]
MARPAENDGEINRLNETSHYAGATDFERPRLLLPQQVSHTLPPPDVIVPYLAEARFGDTAAQRKESFMLKLVWLRDRVRQMPLTNDPKTLRQYAQWYIMLLIEGYLLTDKSNNLVHVRWLPLLWDFTECKASSWGSAVLAWTYQSVCLATQRGWCPPDRGIYQYPLAARLVGLQQQSRDQHQVRFLMWRVSIDRLRFDELDR